MCLFGKYGLSDHFFKKNLVLDLLVNFAFYQQ